MLFVSASKRLNGVKTSRGLSEARMIERRGGACREGRGEGVGGGEGRESEEKHYGRASRGDLMCRTIIPSLSVMRECYCQECA